MRAVTFDHTLRVTRNNPRPNRGPGQSLIRVRYAGICSTDLEITKGYMQFSGVLGHEFVGIVEDSDHTELRGKRVVGEINLACGKCEFCGSTLRTHCPNRTVLGIAGHPGAMADYCVLPDANLHVVPQSVPDEEAVFVEPLAAAFEIIFQITLSPKHHVVVLGDGKLGLLTAQVLGLSGADVRLVGHSAEKLSLARSLSIPIASRETLAQNAADVVVDCTGSSAGLPDALGLVKPRGTVVLKTTVADKYQIDLAPVVINEILVLGSRCGPFEPAIAALAQGSVKVRELITAVYPLEQAVEAFARASERYSLKVLLRL